MRLSQRMEVKEPMMAAHYLVVCVGHKKSWWDKFIEYIQSIPGFDWRAEYQSGGYGPY